MVELYHISSYDYKVGESISMNLTCNYHNNTVVQQYGWVNDFLDNARPERAPERKKSIYAFDNPDFCVEFFKKQYPGAIKTAKLYKVSMSEVRKVPIALVSYIREKGKGHSQLSDIANEYWVPTQNWKAYEYISNEMSIVEIIKIRNKKPWEYPSLLSLITDDRDLLGLRFP